MTFGDLPGRVLVPTIIPVAVVLLVAGFGIWAALHSRGKPFEETSHSLPPRIPVDEKFLGADVMV